MDTQLGYWRWKLFRWNDHPNPYRNRSDLAFTWLSQFQGNTSAMAELRNLLAVSATGAYTTTEPNLVLQQIADKMASGEIQACVEVCGPVALTTSAGLPAEVAEADISQLQSAPPSPAPAPVPDSPIQSTLDPDTDAPAQAAILKAAAEKGIPFCEECEKAAPAVSGPVSPSPKKARIAAPVDPAEPTFSPAGNAVAQARALKEAAQSGACFCEECEKARLALQAQGEEQ